MIEYAIFKPSKRCKASRTGFTKGSEDMEGMTEKQTRKLIEWLKVNGFSSDKIVECLEYINSKK